MLVLIVAVVGGGYAYLWYRYDQINKVHINAEVAVASGGPFTVLVIGSDSRVGESAGGQAFGSSSVVTGQRSDVVQLWRVTPSTKQIQIISIPRDTVVSMLPPDTVAVRHLQPDQLLLQHGGRPAGQDDHGQLRHPDQPRGPGGLLRLPGRRQRAGRHLPRLPLPGQGRLLGPRHHRRRAASCSTAPRRSAVARARHYEYYANGYWQYDGTSDFGRIQRQDVFIKSLISSAKSKVNPLTVNAFIGSIHEGVTIDDGFGFNELIGLALAYHSFDPSNLAGPDAAHRGGQRLRRAWATC